MNEIVDDITKKFADEGRLIEGGWMAFKLTVLPVNASDVQVSEMRKAFFAGAQHLFASIMTFLDDGSEPTQRDVDRLSLIDNELAVFYAEMKKEVEDNASRRSTTL